MRTRRRNGRGVSASEPSLPISSLTVAMFQAPSSLAASSLVVSLYRYSEGFAEDEQTDLQSDPLFLLRPPTARLAGTSGDALISDVTLPSARCDGDAGMNPPSARESSPDGFDRLDRPASLKTRVEQLLRE